MKESIIYYNGILSDLSEKDPLATIMDYSLKNPVFLPMDYCLKNPIFLTMEYCLKDNDCIYGWEVMTGPTLTI